MEVYAINTGFIRMKGNHYLFPGLSGIREYPVIVYIIKIDEKILLFDTGLIDGLTNKIGILNKFIDIVVDETDLLGKLDLIGIKADSIDYIINSHMHFDHCSGNCLFKGIPILVQRKEYLFGLLSKRNLHYLKSNYSFENNYIFLRCNKDVFNDNKVRLLVSPGHSFGHQILIIEDGLNYLMFLGDSCYKINGKLCPIEVEGMPNYRMSLETVYIINNLIHQNVNKNVVCFFTHELNEYDESNNISELVCGIKKFAF